VDHVPRFHIRFLS